jgi:16S rRNA processing protein RimM
LLVFRVLAPQGLRGDLRVQPFGAWERLGERELRWGPRVGEGRPCRVLWARPHRVGAVIHVAGVDDRAAAEAVQGFVAWSTPAELPALPPGQWYVFELLGKEVQAEDGTLGTVADVSPGRPHDLLVVRTPAGQERLVPFVRALVADVTADSIRLTVPLSFFDAEDAP